LLTIAVLQAGLALRPLRASCSFMASSAEESVYAALIARAGRLSGLANWDAFLTEGCACGEKGSWNEGLKGMPLENRSETSLE
jgi:hypothetical protein